MTGWTLAIDFGTSSTSAAVDDGTAVDLIEVDSSRYLPSAVYVGEEGMAVGRSALSKAAVNPERAVLLPKRALAAQEHVRLGGQSVATVDLVAAVLRHMAAEGARRFGNVAPSRLVLTHPARWGVTERGALADAATAAGLPDPQLVAEPVAAASFYALRGQVPVGSCVGVYDLGGGTYDTAVLRRTENGFELLAVGGDDAIGGEDFDDELERLVGAAARQADPELWEGLQRPGDKVAARARWRLRGDVRVAKEELSRTASQQVIVFDRLDVSVTRGELERAISGDIAATVQEFVATVERAGVGLDELAAVYLVGGASRMPLVSDAITEVLGRLPDLESDPKCVVVQGALQWARLVPPAAPRPRPWRYTGRSSASQLAPAALGGAVVAADSRGWVSVRDAATGAKRWKTDLDRPLHRPVVADGLIVLASREKGLTALRPADGKEAWRLRTEVLTCPPTVADGTVYAATMTGLLAVDTSSGRLRWQHNVGSPAWAAPTVHGALVAVGLDDGRVVAVSTVNGAVRWSYPAGAEIWASGIGYEDLLVIGDVSGRVHAIDAERGLVRWVHEMPGDVEAAPVVHGSGVYAADATGTVRHLDAATGALRRSWQLPAGLRGTGTLLDGELLYLPDSSGTLSVLDLGTGSLRAIEVTGGELSAPAVDSAMIYVASGESVYAVDPRPRAPLAVAR
ncbi:hsp70 family protein [Catellatospora citrea]|uniref:Pyrrolo-quinoline quinone repeat domain-containing protein n=1 Tax=Catellatospora citrea TaxID=53366 RepID=A0A8J3NY44_9ACTN|nr:hsp70 family protein [Catellatospora citrea]RKE11178.1 PQQ enzyme-like repeat protein [Catellatospora citrea]GIF96643.1 hypothetical protein Cci01nite_17370 [Catellatospora citrea]